MICKAMATLSYNCLVKVQARSQRDWTQVQVHDGWEVMAVCICVYVIFWVINVSAVSHFMNYAFDMEVVSWVAYALL